MNLLKTLSTVSGLTLLSRITGLIRDILINTQFGANALTDAFHVAFRLPNLLRRLFGEGAFSQAFVPILGDIKAKNELALGQGDAAHAATQAAFNKIATALFWVLVLTSLLGVIGAPILVYGLASGLANKADPAGFEAAVLMTRIMFPYIMFMSLVAMAAGVLNTWKKFAIPAFTPVLLNVSMIAAALWLSRYFHPPILALTIGVMVGGALQLAAQFWALAKLRLAPRIGMNPFAAWRDESVQRVMKQMGPALLGVSVAQISLLINTNIATYLQPGSVTWLTNADRLMEFPTAILGVALGTVLLPSLTRAHTNADAQRYSDLLDWGLRLTLLLALPAAAGLALLALPLSTTLMQYGKFTALDAAMTAQATLAYGVGLIGLIAIKILAPGFYAKQDIRTPVKIALWILVITQIMNVLFVPLFKHAGLALAIGLGSCLNALILLIALLRRGSYKPQAGWFGFSLKVIVAVICMSAVLLPFAHYELWHWFNWTAKQAWYVRAMWLSAAIGAGIVTYFMVLAALGFRPRHFKRID